MPEWSLREKEKEATLDWSRGERKSRTEKLVDRYILAKVLALPRAVTFSEVLFFDFYVFNIRV
jgi:hypothetical protein